MADLTAVIEGLQRVADGHLDLIEKLTEQIQKLAEVGRMHQKSIDSLAARVAELERRR